MLHQPRGRTRLLIALEKIMFEGNARAALQLLTGQDHGGVLNLNDPAHLSNPECSVHDAFSSKHPPTQSLRPDSLLSTTGTPAVHPVVFDALDASIVHATALCTVGVA